MSRQSPVHYIAPSAINIIPNANGEVNDLAIYIEPNTVIKVYSPKAGIDHGDDGNFREWALSGRNRSLADSHVPYTIYARLNKFEESAYVTFAPKVYDEDAHEYIDKYAYVTTEGLSADVTSEEDARGYWYIKIGEVSAPENTESGFLRTVTLDTGVLGTDEYNTKWNLSPEALPLRLDLECMIDGEDPKAAGPTPYLYWGQVATLTAHITEGWNGTDIQRFDHWEIVRNTGNAVADAAWNTAHNIQMLDYWRTGVINLQHQRGAEQTDDFDGTVSAIFTVNAMQLSPEWDGSSTEPQYILLKSVSINIMAETVEKFEVAPATAVMAFNPMTSAYTPSNGILLRIRAISQKGDASQLSNGQYASAGLTCQYAPEGSSTWTEITSPGPSAGTWGATVPVSAFSDGKSVNVRILRDNAELHRATIAYVRDGEDSKEREWIFLRSAEPITFGTQDHPYPATIAQGKVNPTGEAHGTDENKNQDGWVPNGWWDDPQGVTEHASYEYGAYRDFVHEDGNTPAHWDTFTTPKIWNHYGKDGERAHYLYLRGTARDADTEIVDTVPCEVNVDGSASMLEHCRRGLNLVTVNRQTLTKVEEEHYDTWGEARGSEERYNNGITNLVAKLESLDDSLYVCLVSFDAVGWSTELITALQSYGMDDLPYTETGRYPFLFIGYKRLGKGNGLTRMRNAGSYNDVAELSVYVANGAFTVKDGESITKKSEDVQYKVADSGTDTPSGTWYGTKAAAIAEKAWDKDKYLWTRTVITWSDRSSTILYSAERNPNDGQPGQSIVIDNQSVKYSKQASGNLDPTTLTYGNYPSSLSKGDWLYSRTTVVYKTDGGAAAGKTVSYSVSYIGTDGENGTGISGITEHYKASASSTGETTPGGASPDDWPTNPSPNDWGKGKRYLWNYEKIAKVDKNGNTTYERTTASVIAIWTENGKGVDSVTNFYKKSNLSTGVGYPAADPDGQGSGHSGGTDTEWSAAVQVPDAADPYLWSYERITWIEPDNTKTYTYTAPHVIGHYGTDGQDVRENLIDNSEPKKIVNVSDVTPSATESLRRFDTGKSFDVTKVPDDTALSGQMRITFAGCSFGTNAKAWLYFNSSDRWPQIAVINNPTNGTHEVCKENFIIGSGHGVFNGIVMLCLQNFNDGGTVTVERVKLEVGAKCSPWCLSENDKKGAKGDPGADAWSFVANPANVIVTQSMDAGASNQFTTAAVSFAAKKGNTAATIGTGGVVLAESSTFECSLSGNVVTVVRPKKDTQGNYYTSGSFTVTITATAGGVTATQTLTVLCYANLLGSWKTQVEGDVEQSIATKKFYFKDENGSIVAHETIGDYIKSSTENISTLITSAAGGSNLLLGSEKYTADNKLDHKSAAADGAIEYNGQGNRAHIYTPIHMEAGKTYTLQIKSDGTLADRHEVKVENQGKFSVWLRINGVKDGVQYNGICFAASNLTGTRSDGALYWTFACEVTGEYWFRTNTYSPNLAEVEVHVWDIMLQEGTIASGWIAPSRGTMSQIKQTADEIEAKVNETGVNITNGEINLIAGKVNFLNEDGQTTNPNVSIDTTTGTLRTKDAILSGMLYLPYTKITRENYRSYVADPEDEHWHIAFQKTGINIQVDYHWSDGSSIYSNRNVDLPYPIIVEYLGAELHIFNARNKELSVYHGVLIYDNIAGHVSTTIPAMCEYVFKLVDISHLLASGNKFQFSAFEDFTYKGQTFIAYDSKGYPIYYDTPYWWIVVQKNSIDMGSPLHLDSNGHIVWST